MDKAEKDALVKKLINTEDDAILDQVKIILSDDKDFWSSLNPKLKASIERGIEQSDKGEVTPHAEVMKQFRDKYKA